MPRWVAESDAAGAAAASVTKGSCKGGRPHDREREIEGREYESRLSVTRASLNCCETQAQGRARRVADLPEASTALKHLAGLRKDVDELARERDTAGQPSGRRRRVPLIMKAHGRRARRVHLVGGRLDRAGASSQPERAPPAPRAGDPVRGRVRGAHGGRAVPAPLFKW